MIMNNVGIRGKVEETHCCGIHLHVYFIPENISEDSTCASHGVYTQTFSKVNVFHLGTTVEPREVRI